MPKYEDVEKPRPNTIKVDPKSTQGPMTTPTKAEGDNPGVRIPPALRSKVKKDPYK